MRIGICIAVVLGCLVATAAHAQNNTNLNRAKNTVNNVRQADPPKVSTSTVVTPQVTRPTTPKSGSDVTRMRTNPPPSPTPPTKKK